MTAQVAPSLTADEIRELAADGWITDRRATRAIEGDAESIRDCGRTAKVRDRARAGRFPRCEVEEMEGLHWRGPYIEQPDGTYSSAWVPVVERSDGTFDPTWLVRRGDEPSLEEIRDRRSDARVRLTFADLDTVVAIQRILDERGW